MFLLPYQPQYTTLECETSLVYLWNKAIYVPSWPFDDANIQFSTGCYALSSEGRDLEWTTYMAEE